MTEIQNGRHFSIKKESKLNVNIWLKYANAMKFVSTNIQWIRVMYNKITIQWNQIVKSKMAAVYRSALTKYSVTVCICSKTICYTEEFCALILEKALINQIYI